MSFQLGEHLNKFSTSPYLFIGSGLSRRYLGLPTWQDLLEKFYNELYLTGDFEYYLSKSQKQLPKLSSILAAEFHEIWWKEKAFTESRKQNKKLAQNGIEIPFKIELTKFLEKIELFNADFNREIELLKSSIIDGIITTNWDTHLNEIFPDYKAYIGQQELLFTDSLSIGEIYKIHGCVTKPDSIIITDEDYKNFNDRNAYLAAKLLTIFVEHPIIFIGYSLSDHNILEILNSIIKCVDNNNIEKLKDRLIFIEWVEGVELSFNDSNIMLPDSKVLPIKLIQADSYEPIFEILSGLKKRLPVKILRKLKDSVIEFVKTSKPNSKVYISDINSLEDISDIEYAIGIGVASQFISAQGYKGIEANDIIEDVLFDNKNYVAKLLIENTFPKLLKGNVYLPVFKYLKAEGYLTKQGTVTPTGNTILKFSIKQNIPNCFIDKPYIKKQAEIRRNHKDVKSLIKAYDETHAIFYLSLLERKNIDLSDLLIFLKKCFKNTELNNSTSFRKLVCLYDYYKNSTE